MNITETNYADYLFLLTPNEAAESFDRVRNEQGISEQEIDYADYRESISNEAKTESEYEIFSNLYDRINSSLHILYFDAFLAIANYNLTMGCQRKKAPNPH